MKDQVAATPLEALVANARQWPRGTAWRAKHRGAWRETSWADAARDVARLAGTLEKVGVGEGDVVAVVGDWEPELVSLDLALGALGAAPLAVSAHLEPAEIVRAGAAAGARFVICTAAGALDALMDAAEEAGAATPLTTERALRGAALAGGSGGGAVSLEGLLGRGVTGAEALRDLAGRAAALDSGRTAFVGFSAGTTGAPRGFEFSQVGALAAARGFAAAIGLRRRDRVLCHLPLSYPLARVLGAHAALAAGASLNFVESRETAIDDMAELAPTVVLASPRLPAALLALHRRRLVNLGGLRGRLGRALDPDRGEGTGAGRRLSLGGAIARRSVRARLGLAAVRWLGCVGSVGGEERRFCERLGLDLAETYCLTEAGGAVLATQGRDRALRPLAGVEVRVEEADRLRLRLPWPLPRPLAAASGQVEDGWLLTDDVGALEPDGEVRLLGRTADHVEHQGRTVSLALCERALSETPLIRTAVALAGAGEGVDFVVELDLERVRIWNQGRDDVLAGAGAEPGAHPELARALTADAREALAALGTGVRLGTVHPIARELLISRAELTTTGTVRRAVVADAFGVASGSGAQRQ